MIKYLLFHSILCSGVLGLLGFLRSAPPRIKLYLACFGMFLWVLPLPLVSLSVELPEPVVYYSMLVHAQTPNQNLNMVDSIFVNFNFWYLFWFTGFVVWGISLYRHHRQVAALNKDTRDGSFLFEQFCLVPRGVSLKIVPGNNAMTTGFINPQIWLGEEIVASDECEAVVLHELTHIHHGDNLWTFGIHFWECMFWWNPFVLFLGKQARYYIELSCDHACQKWLGLDYYQSALASLMLNQIGLRQSGALAVGLVSDGKQGINRIRFMDTKYKLKRSHALPIAGFVLLGSVLAAVPAPRVWSLASNVAPSAYEEMELENNVMLIKDEMSVVVPRRVGAEGVTPPVFTKKVAPVYPEKGIAVKLEGYVILEGVLHTDGSWSDIKVLRGLGKGKFGFEEASIEALKQWEFKPGSYNGEPTDVRMTLKLDFSLD